MISKKGFIKPSFILISLLVIIVGFSLYGCGISKEPETGSGSITEPVPATEPEPEPQVELANYYDVIIYGGTPSGVMSAIAASREGAKVAIIEPSDHLGGMLTGGLSFSDVGNSKVIGGLAKEFFERVGEKYDSKVCYYFEPGIAERVILEMVSEADIDIYYGQRLKENGGVDKTETSISRIRTEEGDAFEAKVYIDCSYEGDLMAKAGVSYTIGRESVQQYDESLAGTGTYVLQHNFRYATKAYTEDHELLPGISDEPMGKIGQADDKIPAYNFRLCLTDNPDNQVSFEKPENYEPYRYQLFANWLKVLKESENNRKLKLADVFYFGSLPNDKYDLNNTGPFSSNYIGESWQYPDADYETREKIVNKHREYLQGLLYFILTDISVPEELKVELNNWGLARDEFIDNENWPYQLYVREGRRMLGDFVMTQKDIKTEIMKTDSIGMGSYGIDSHNVRRFITSKWNVLNEGSVQIPVKQPYQIPYEILLPKAEEISNLLVPVCMSASHIAYSSLRMEPQYMILGQAAGIAAKIAIDEKCSVQDISIKQLQSKLVENGAVLKLQR